MRAQGRGRIINISSVLGLVIVMAVWAIVTGVMEVIAAVELRHVVPNEWFLIISGLLSVAFGMLLLVQPGAGALALAWLIGLYAVVFGVSMLALARRLRLLLEHMPAASSRTPQARAV